MKRKRIDIMITYSSDTDCESNKKNVSDHVEDNSLEENNQIEHGTTTYEHACTTM
jgi:hypothetical protein